MGSHTYGDPDMGINLANSILPLNPSPLNRYPRLIRRESRQNSRIMKNRFLFLQMEVIFHVVFVANFFFLYH